MRGSQRDLAAGLIFIAFGVAFAGIAATYKLGTPLRMGPGLFPLLLGCLLIVLGAGVIVQGWANSENPPIGTWPWRAIILIAASVLFFGLSVRRLGLAPALFGAVLLTAFSSQRTTILAALAMSIGLSAFSIFIFVELLGMPVPLIGPWLKF